jgi:hypothetical protein
MSRLRSVTPQQEGRDYEAELAARLGGKAQPNSGAGPRWKLDLKLGSLLFSVKHTLHESYRLKAEDLREALAGAQGPGGRGEIPAMAIKMQGFPDDIFVLRGSDLTAILEAQVDVGQIEATTKRAAKLAAARR